ncbi:MAG: hormogonium polysaccharide biosynthesis glycosyltransferase HpsN [Limnospira sp. PMC 1291.21]|uniref:Glycosyl transferase family 2 n=2 Tax=Limnospira TaxID=2596745 RepID=B5W7Q7_LIMMA|nr:MULTISPECIES: hormogonium polysaccharide biosynthesis glycosyltransferase HpsN [Limnospira]MDC0839854.1 hormogonium polysaccharide biosynthesis glycosyltransferase HpsN [Limnoraphis robusta]MDY7053869.1 hormogonium polysaccharide biosynthesis glycosyltransferase HpsN [Limnospira fusiformis LS22]QJB28891.1 glycosyltransferase family 2 protein [Limnospira fusiformis SAG 85.79]EDZ92436.1 glycosyl transferase family 2 [Limnospira maxima CS-328]MDT9179321.1 hormogonium polysaccharide biosynthesi
MNLPKVSVIIPTYGREELLRNSLSDVMNNDYPDLEILVVDQTKNHEPETQEYLEKFSKSGKISWFKLDWASLPGARNYGVRRATGDIVIFIDDDVTLETSFVMYHVRNYLDHPEIGAVAGRVLTPEHLQGTHKQPTFDYLPPEASDPGIAWYYLDVVNTIKPQKIISGRGCNMSFRRSLFTDHGIWFDERFRGSAVREESDFFLDIRKTDYQIWYDPEAVLVHIGEPTGGCHDISTRSLEYQITHYHNHFLMAFKHLTWKQSLHLYIRLFDCHVLGHPPCNKSGGFTKIIARGIFYFWGFFRAIWTQIQGLWNDGQIYTRQDPQAMSGVN